MKILMIGTDKRLFDPGSDIENRFIEYAKLFDELHVIVFTRKGFKEYNLLPNLRLYPTNSWNRWWYIFDAVRIGRRIKMMDIVSAQDPFECGIVAWCIARYIKAKLQLQIHTDFLNKNFFSESFLNRLRVIIARFLLPQANCIRVVSARIKNSLQKQMNIKERCITILPIFVDKEYFQKNYIKTNIRSKYSFASHIILAASRFTREKNISMGIQAMKEIRKFYPNALLLFVGDGPEKKKMQTLIDKHDLHKNVIIESWIDDLRPYYGAADIFIITSHYEGYGRTAVEAALYDKPVIMTDVGIAIGSVVPVEDVSVLSKRIIEILGSDDKKNQIVARQREFLLTLPSRREYQHLFSDQFNACI